ncbi:UPF0182 family protein [Kocuria sp. p3-SID1428]|uniref:UPF0182 family membrane protein n=2 Tax=unclassified Kocuria TaxID=2649579 RepID=UPI0021A65D1A|nr:UPF0182 family protein [Kocuria sp. p3-SID1428]MCT1601522.1 UPF0182 family protein [Kocuria sp. p3-SID1428]
MSAGPAEPPRPPKGPSGRTPAGDGPAARQSRRNGALLPTVIIVVALIAAFVAFTQVYTEILWFDQLGYLNVFATQNIARAGLFIVAALLVAGLLWTAMRLAYRNRPITAADAVDDNLRRYQQAFEPVRRIAMIAVPALFGLFTASTIASQWETVLLFFHQVPFGQEDPEFGMDLAFWVFTLPFLQLVIGFLSSTLLLCGIAALLVHYLYGAIRLSERGLSFSRAARVQLAVTAAAFLVLQGVNFWLDRYATLNNTGGSWTGAMYTDINAVIPVRGILAAAALVVAALFIASAIMGRWRLPMIGTAMLVIVAVVAGGIYPSLVQRFQVLPSEQQMEDEYIQRNIDGTRAAFDLEDTETQPYDATTQTKEGALADYEETTSNIRLLDPNVVSPAFAQLQQFRPYYSFPSTLNVDRYEIDGQVQDTVLAARELNQGETEGWYNQHVVYTHGYGMIAAFGDRVEADGSPSFIQGGIKADGEISEDYEPRIYFGEQSPEYSIVGGTEEDPKLELDRPSTTDDEDDDVRTTFSGDGGPNVGNPLNRLSYAIKFQSTDLMFSDAVRPDSQVLFDRTPRERVEKVAPYLTVDGNPYPAIVDGEVKWIVDAYTTSDAYPYSTPMELDDATEDTSTAEGASAALPSEQANYMRNSVKATVDAYDGSVDLYAWDEQDPVLQAWQGIFPASFKPYSEMSADLMEHVRYPEDIFKVQRELLNRYHVTDSGSFYAGDDVWSIPNDPTTDVSTAIPPYYLSMQMPGESEASFQLTTPFIPQQNEGENSRNVLYGYLAANGDAGTGEDGVKSDEYGDLKLLELPRSSVVPGPGQAQNNFNSNTEVSSALNLLRQGGSEVINGNMLALPVNDGMMYIQPVYVRSSGESGYPTLRRVLVSFGEEVGFAPTLDEALDQVFGGDSGAETTDGAGVTEEEAAQAAEGGEQPAEEEQSSDGETSAPSGGADLDSALSDAADAMADSQTAMEDGDWAAYGEAQDRLDDALNRAMTAEGIDTSASPGPTDPNADQ